MISAESTCLGSIPSENALSRDGNIIHTPAFDLLVEVDRVRIKNRRSQKSIEFWSTTAVLASAGTGARSNLLVDLPDGSRVSISVTPSKELEVPQIDTIAVTHRRELILVRNVFEASRDAAAKLDATDKIRVRDAIGERRWVGSVRQAIGAGVAALRSLASACPMPAKHSLSN